MVGTTWQGWHWRHADLPLTEACSFEGEKSTMDSAKSFLKDRIGLLVGTSTQDLTSVTTVQEWSLTAMIKVPGSTRHPTCRVCKFNASLSHPLQGRGKFAVASMLEGKWWWSLAVPMISRHLRDQHTPSGTCSEKISHAEKLRTVKHHYKHSVGRSLSCRLNGWPVSARVKLYFILPWDTSPAPPKMRPSLNLRKACDWLR